MHKSIKPVVRARISASVLKNNTEMIQQQCPHSKVLSIVKANAYGHGLIKTAELLASISNGLGVARLEEAISIRESGINIKPLLVMSPAKHSDLFEYCGRYELDFVLQSMEEIKQLQSIKLKKPLRIWLKVNCGLNRLGLAPSECNKAMSILNSMQEVSTMVVMSHFSSSSTLNCTTTEEQLQLFNDATKDITLPKSIANSGAIVRFKSSYLDWVRPGLLSYGIHPVKGLANNINILPAMTFEAQIIAKHKIKAGQRVGYGGVWCAKQETLIAVVGAGYADGYPCFDEGASVYALLSGRRVAVIGQVSMDMLAIDISDCPHAQLGDWVQLWGQDITVNEVAIATKRRLYTLLTGISERVARVYD